MWGLEPEAIYCGNVRVITAPAFGGGGMGLYQPSIHVLFIPGTGSVRWVRVRDLPMESTHKRAVEAIQAININYPVTEPHIWVSKHDIAVLTRLPLTPGQRAILAECVLLLASEK